MENQIRLLGILTIAVGALNGLIAVIQFLFGGGLSIAITLGISTVLVEVWLWIMLLLTLPSIVLGIALLSFKPWARTFGIILAIFQLLSLPLGTGVGLFGLFVLFSEGADLIFNRRFGEYTIMRR